MERKKKKNPIQSLLKAWFLMVWTLLGLGRDTNDGVKKGFMGKS